VNALFDVRIPRLVKNPKLRAVKLDNITQVFKMLEKANVKTHFLKVGSVLNSRDKALSLIHQTHHLIDEGDRTMRLGMIWTLILEYAIKGISVDELTVR
jgi:hypothetical protein